MATTFSKRLVNIAIKEHQKYYLIREQQEPLTSQIQNYWTDVSPFPGVSTPWSGVFISWSVRQAGATADEFRFAAAHARFVRKAIQDYKNQLGVFHGRNVDDYAPKVGDILQNNRSGNSFDYSYASTHSEYESHSAIVIEVGADHLGRYLRTIGGNEGDSFGLKEVRLDSDGYVKNPKGLYISVIETLK
ncbi:uncharacterized protein DUF2272 [Nitrosospira multiformis]|uniref:Uncharacterized protein DUF2272 n=1 Tax=Nitrosospira multiformis TaxID=1231 RepID=A0A2T5I662_9PROT|nr:DUF2272 domain-containing protein [Nitrosospira multiformis]PTQ79315.1 uncharacterized protein DUF2272 [Nitrosospira multiformis]